MATFETDNNKRTLKINQLKELIGKMETFLAEGKSIQFLDQKIKQIGILWSSILDNTESMMNK